MRETRDTFLDQFSEKTTEIYAANGGGDGGLLFAFLSFFFLFKHRLLNVLFQKPPILPKRPSLSLSNIQKVFTTYARVVMLRVESITTFISPPLVVWSGGSSLAWPGFSFVLENTAWHSRRARYFSLSTPAVVSISCVCFLSLSPELIWKIVFEACPLPVAYAFKSHQVIGRCTEAAIRRR